MTNNIIHELSFDAQHRMELFLELPQEESARILLRLSKHVRKNIVESLSNDQLITVLHYLDPDEATDIVQILTPHRRKKIMSMFGVELRKNIEVLSQFDPNTAAGLMNLDYIQVDSSDTIADAAKQFQIHEKRTGRLPVIIVLEIGRMCGYLPGHTLGFARKSDKVRKHIQKIHSIKYNSTYDELVRLFRSHPHNKIVVIGEKGNIIGIIYSDDVLRIINERESKSLYSFAGVSNEETVTDTILHKVKFRYKWLIINLATAFLAAFTVSIFHDTISKYVLLAVYMPIVAGMGGNAGTQTLAVLIRGITLNQISLKTALPVIRREMIAGLINGLINGLIVAGIVIAFNRDIRIAIVLAMAMIVNLLVAGFFGTLVPLIMKRLGKDPATSATIFITTATDVLGFMAFLGLATLVLR